MSNASEKPLLRREAAKYLGLSLSGLAHMASRGAGPRYSMEGKRAVYTKSDLDAWITAQAHEAAVQQRLKALLGQLRSKYREQSDRRSIFPDWRPSRSDGPQRGLRIRPGGGHGRQA
jgi:hypothetical protein